MNPTLATIGRILLLLLILTGVVYFWIRAFKRTEDQPTFVYKWLATLVIGVLLIWKVTPLVGRGGFGGAFGGIPAAVACGFILAAMWRRNLASIVANFFGGLYDGGNEEIDAKPLYSTAQSKRKRGHYQEAIEEVRGQLARFPQDFEGQLLVAEILVENLNDLAGADATIQRICSQRGHAPGNLALALNWLADWHLKYGRDVEAAQLALEKIMFLLPDTEFSALAAQRIAHLASPEHLLSSHDRKKFVVAEGAQNLGLLDPALHPKAPETDVTKQAAEYVQQLQAHPLDTEVREKLALLYADHYGRLEMAVDQLEQLIAMPTQPAKRVVHWLNLLADLQVRHGADPDAVCATVQRIIDLFPESAAAHVARSRLDRIRLEVKGQGKGRGVKLGTYEQDIGLKRGLPNKL